LLSPLAALVISLLTLRRSARTERLDFPRRKPQSIRETGAADVLLLLLRSGRGSQANTGVGRGRRRGVAFGAPLRWRIWGRLEHGNPRPAARVETVFRPLVALISTARSLGGIVSWPSWPGAPVASATPLGWFVLRRPPWTYARNHDRTALKGALVAGICLVRDGATWRRGPRVRPPVASRKTAEARRGSVLEAVAISGCAPDHCHRLGRSSW